MKKFGIIIGLLVLAILSILLYRRVSCYESTLVDTATQMLKERIPATEVIKALEAKGASEKDAFEIAKEAAKRL
jgi:uncharacterized membrane protein